MNCPKCNIEMIEGFIHTAGFIYWDENDKARVISGDELIIGRDLLKNRKTAAYKCEECKLVTFEYGI